MRAFLVALQLTGPVMAETSAPEAELTGAEAYARDVTLMFFCHEMGHALIDVLDAPQTRCPSC